MAETNIYRVTPRQVRGFISDCLFAKLVPYVQSSPGCGKSSIMRSIADELNLQLIDHRLSTSEPTDISGLPRFNKNGFAEFVPFEGLFPLVHTPIPEGKLGWMLFLDEFSSARKDVQSACYKLILDRAVGQHSLHPNVVITAAGNLATDRAIVNPLSTAMQSRVVHLEMYVSFEEWLYDVALKENYDPRIIAFLSQYPNLLMDFRPDHQEKTFSSPRTWEFVNRLIKGREFGSEITPLIAGTITSGVAANFVQFTQVYKSLIPIQEILDGPFTCRLSTDLNIRWSTITHMMEKVTHSNFDQLSNYADRFDMSMRILFYRAILVRKPELRRHPAFLRAMATLNKYLHG